MQPISLHFSGRGDLAEAECALRDYSSRRVVPQGGIGARIAPNAQDAQAVRPFTAVGISVYSPTRVRP